MTDIRDDSKLTNLLRLGAVLGVLLSALAKVLTVQPLQSYQYFGFIFIGIFTVAFCAALFIFLPGTAVRILRNPDLLVPVGLYVTAHEIVGWLIGTASVSLFKDGNISFDRFTGAILTSWVLQIVIACCFVGWMTRIVLRFDETGRVDLVGSFRRIGWWFPRTFGVLLFGMIPFLVASLLILPFILKGGFLGLNRELRYPYIALIAISGLLWNMATAALMPYVLSTKSDTVRAIGKGIRFSWAYKSKTILPIIVLSVLCGWIVFISLSYTEYENTEKTAFGKSSSTSSYSETNHTKWNFSTRFAWTVDYPEGSEWYPELMGMVKRDPLPSINFRIMLLMLLLSLAVNMKIVSAIREGEEDVIESEGPQGRSKFQTGIAIFAVLLAFMIPFEYSGSAWSSRPPDQAPEQSGLELVVPKIYTGEETFNRKELFRYEKSEEKKNEPRLTVSGSGEGSGTGSTRGTGSGSAAKPRKYELDKDEFELNDIEQIYTGEVDDEPGTDILAAGRTDALILTPEGKVKKKIDYNLGKYRVEEDFDQVRDLAFIRISDLDGDGKPEIAGHGAYTCEILDLNGRSVWKYGQKGFGSSVDALRIGDVDNDGENEILVAKETELEAYSENGRRKWSADISDSIFGDLEIVDIDNDGKNEIIAGKSIFDGSGKHVKDIKQPYSVHGFLNQKGENFSFVFFERNKMGLFSSENLRAEYEAPLSYIQKIKEPGDTDFNLGMSVFSADALYVKFGADKSKYLAVLADANDDGGYDTFQILYIYDSERKLVYHENFQAMTGEMSILPNEDGTESLLVVDDGKILKYSLN